MSLIIQWVGYAVITNVTEGLHDGDITEKARHGFVFLKVVD